MEVCEEVKKEHIDMQFHDVTIIFISIKMTLG